MEEDKKVPEPLDPKVAMRAALERKRAAIKQGSQEAQHHRDQVGGPHGQATSKRQFRRKSG